MKYTIFLAMMLLGMVAYANTDEITIGTTSVDAVNIGAANADSGRKIAVDFTGQIATVAINAFLVQSSASSEQLVPLTHGMAVHSGDVVEYHAYFTNRSPERIRSMAVLLNVPQGMKLVGGLVPESPFVSIDGMRFSRLPLQAGDLMSYRSLRWDISDIGLGGTAVVKYRAKMQ